MLLQPPLRLGVTVRDPGFRDFGKISRIFSKLDLGPGSRWWPCNAGLRAVLLRPPLRLGAAVRGPECRNGSGLLAWSIRSHGSSIWHRAALYRVRAPSGCSCYSRGLPRGAGFVRRCSVSVLFPLPRSSRELAEAPARTAPYRRVVSARTKSPRGAGARGAKLPEPRTPSETRLNPHPKVSEP